MISVPSYARSDSNRHSVVVKRGRCVLNFLKLLQVFGTQILKKNPEARNKTEHLLVFWGFFLSLYVKLLVVHSKIMCQL